jgi:hypothetical protein
LIKTQPEPVAFGPAVAARGVLAREDEVGDAADDSAAAAADGSDRVGIETSSDAVFPSSISTCSVTDRDW